jgi:hypothetical protein
MCLAVAALGANRTGKEMPAITGEEVLALRRKDFSFSVKRQAHFGAIVQMHQARSLFAFGTRY